MSELLYWLGTATREDSASVTTVHANGWGSGHAYTITTRSKIHDRTSTRHFDTIGQMERYFTRNGISVQEGWQ